MKVPIIYNKKSAEVSDVINIFGPQTKEKYNHKTVELVASALEKGGHNVKKIEGNINVAESLRDFMPKVMAGERPGMVFNMAYGIQGQSRYTHIPAMLEMLGIPYVGSGPQAHAVALDKVMSKVLFQQNNIPTPRFWFFSSPDEKMDDVEYPVIVKPKMEAVSMGLRVVDNEIDLRDAVAYIIQEYQQQALVEAFIAGREFAVGLLGNGPDQEVLPIVEMDFKGDPQAIQTKDDKLIKPIEKICPAEIPGELAREIRSISQVSFYALGIHDFGRVDMRMDEKGKLFVLELNSMASLGLSGSYVTAAKAAGYSFQSLVNRMLDVASVRYFGEMYLQRMDISKKTGKQKPLRIRLRSYIRSYQPTMEDTLRKMVEMNTHVYNAETVNDLGNFITGHLEQIGFEKLVYPRVDIGNCLYFTNHKEEQNDILLWNHLDNRANYREYVSFYGERGRYYGSGVAENKGGLSVMIAALRALRFARILKKIKCGILLTTDYSLGGVQSKKLVEEISLKSKFVVGLKWSESHGGIVTSCHGRAAMQIEFSNVKSSINGETKNVITALCKKIITLQKISSAEGELKLFPVSLDARTSIGTSPDYAMGTINIQFMNKEQGDKLIKDARDLVRKNLDKTIKVQIKQLFYRPPVKETEETRRFFDSVKQLADTLEMQINAFQRTISSEISYVPAGIPVLDGLGPTGGSTHTSHEYIYQDSIIDRAVLLAMIIQSCTQVS